MITIHKYCTILLLLIPMGMLNSQTVSDLGMMGGSGMVFTPTLAVAPESHFRLDMARLSFLKSGNGGVNSLGITSGLSPNMEFTARFQSMQAGTTLSPAFTGFGAKFLIPYNFPAGTRAALWGEIVSTSNENTTRLYPSSVSRSSLILQPGILTGVNGNVFLGITNADHVQHFAAGGNASVILGKFLKLGGEYEYNYYGNRDKQGSMLILVRVHPNFCLQLSPGYLQSPVASSWMFSAGISISTASIEFVNFEKPKDQAPVVPSFDELQKQINDDKKKEN